MISAAYCRHMADYNRWQNASLIAAADPLSPEARWQDRGAFFQSIAATFNHLLWADALMLERLKGNERPQDQITHSLVEPSIWSDFKTLRLQRDTEITLWAQPLTDADLEGVIAWYPLDGAPRMEKETSLCAVQLFSHQTHHRGQIHAMLTAAGAHPGPTDLVAMPR